MEGSAYIGIEDIDQIDTRVNAAAFIDKGHVWIAVVQWDKETKEMKNFILLRDTTMESIIRNYQDIVATAVPLSEWEKLSGKSKVFFDYDIREMK